MFEDDYIMRQVEITAAILSKIVFGKTLLSFKLPEEPDTYTGADRLYLTLLDLLAGGQINQAENLLFDQADVDDLRYLEVAIDFYLRLNRYDDEKLEELRYSREEINDGLRDIAAKFGITV